MTLYLYIYMYVYTHVGCAKFPREMFSEEVQNVPKNAPPPSGPMAFILNSEEQMFTEMRDLNFRAVGQFLSREAKKITALYEVMQWLLSPISIIIILGYTMYMVACTKYIVLIHVAHPISMPINGEYDFI